MRFQVYKLICQVFAVHPKKKKKKNAGGRILSYVGRSRVFHGISRSNPPLKDPSGAQPGPDGMAIGAGLRRFHPAAGERLHHEPLPTHTELQRACSREVDCAAANGPLASICSDMFWNHSMEDQTEHLGIKWEKQNAGQRNAVPRYVTDELMPKMQTALRRWWMLSRTRGTSCRRRTCRHLEHDTPIGVARFCRTFVA